MSEPFFSIKICGVRTAEDLQAVVRAGADAIGINFYRPSIRFVALEIAKQLSAQAAALSLKKVGVFVNHAIEEVIELASICQLDAVQFHGNENPDELQPHLRRLPRVIGAVRLPHTELSVAQIDRRVEPWQALGCSVLLDADVGADFGGSGRSLDWSVVYEWSKQATTLPRDWTLAGGLRAANVAEAIEVTRAWSIDVASGVEQPKGTKSAQLISEFVGAAQDAWERTGSGNDPRLSP